MKNSSKRLRTLILVLLGAYLFMYPGSVVLVAFDMVPTWGVVVGELLLIAQGSLMGLWLVLNHGRRGLLAALAILLLSWAVEHIGVKTGFPFGGYHYTEALQLKLFEIVPLAVPFAWLMVVPAAVGIAEYLLPREGQQMRQTLAVAWQQSAALARPRQPWVRLWGCVRGLLADTPDPSTAPTVSAEPVRRSLFALLIIVLGAASFALLLDLMIEPVAVYINGYWVWNNTGGGYYGVPGSNFVAWWVTSLLLASILVALTRLSPGRVSCSGPSYPWLGPLLYILNLTMFAVVTLAHGKLLAGTIGLLLLGYFGLAWLEPRLVRWVMGDAAATAIGADQPRG